MANYGQHFSTRQTVQTERARNDQVLNNAGGFVFKADLWERLDRWLILGSDGGTYYASERKLTKDNAKTILECLAADGKRTVARIVEVSDRGLAPKNDPAIFALAMACAADSPETRKEALAAIPKVCRIGTHLFHFARDVESFRGWGKGLAKAISAWYAQPADRLERDLVKYRQRDGWAHRDLLRLAHPTPASPAHNALFRYVVTGSAEPGGERLVRRAKGAAAIGASTYAAVPELSSFIMAFEEAQKTDSKSRLIQLVQEHGLTHEMLPSQWKSDPAIWEALLNAGMPMTALMRNLGKLSNVGLLTPMSAAEKSVVKAFSSVASIKKARLHPLALLIALKTYAQGHGEKGKLTWTASRAVVDALNDAFYLAFDNIEPTGKARLIALDVSGSMDSPISGMPISCREASAAMAMAVARTEKDWLCMGFSTRFMNLDISPKMRLDDVVKKLYGMPFAGTDCAVPMLWALEHKAYEVDSFEIWTDSETYAGRVHPFQALKQFREKSGKMAKLAVVGMTATDFTIADPSDAGSMDFVGLSADVPQVLSSFIAGPQPARSTTGM